jgi:hypothetical protein
MSIKINTGLWGACFARVGAGWNNGLNAGLSNWNLNNPSWNSNVNIGRQTLIRKFKDILHPIIRTAW